MDVLINTWLDRPLYRYGISPNKWIDYMMAEKPLLVSFSGFDTIIKEADCGFVVPAEDKNALAKKIIFLSGMEKKELKRMGENGKKYLLANLTYEKLSEELNNSLIEIINKKRKICVQ
jgi:glycosyltransferase involved in cell wall biosynthesis